jgi:hypothetical protein
VSQICVLILLFSRLTVFCGELYPDGCFWIIGELIFFEAGEEVRLAYAWIWAIALEFYPQSPPSWTGSQSFSPLLSSFINLLFIIRQIISPLFIPLMKPYSSILKISLSFELLWNVWGVFELYLNWWVTSCPLSNSCNISSPKQT